MIFELTKEQDKKFVEWTKTLEKSPGAHYHFTFTPTMLGVDIIVVSRDDTSEVLHLTDNKVFEEFKSGTHFTEDNDKS